MQSKIRINCGKRINVYKGSSKHGHISALADYANLRDQICANKFWTCLWSSLLYLLFCSDKI